VSGTWWRLRASEKVLAAYFLYTSVLAFVLPVSARVSQVTLAMNLIVLGGLALIAYAHSLRRREPLAVLRDWYVPPLLLLAYREMGWFALPHASASLEQSWVVWDRWLLNEAGLRAVIELLGPALPLLLEAAYTLVYAMPPFGLAMLYAFGRRRRAEALLCPLTLAVLSTYALFPPVSVRAAVDGLPWREPADLRFARAALQCRHAPEPGNSHQRLPVGARRRLVRRGVCHGWAAAGTKMGRQTAGGAGRTDRAGNRVRPLPLRGGRRGRLCHQCGRDGRRPPLEASRRG
jgi:hypothetical protein